MKTGLTFDDVALVPQFNNVASRTEPSTETWLTQNIKMDIPLIPANMDCVIGDELADVIIKRGGVPFFHRFCEIDQQQLWIKRYEDKAVYSVGLDPDNIHSLLNFGAKNFVFDIAHGHSLMMMKQIEYFKTKYPYINIIAGNVCTSQGYRDLVNSGADAIKVGVGAGAACSTRTTTGFGVPQFTAILDCANESKKYKVPIIADGGIRSSREVALALAGGACSVMIGKLFALTNESSATKIGGSYKETYYSEITGKDYEMNFYNPIQAKYRGQASLDFQNDLRGGLKVGTVPEGEHFWADVTGSADELIDTLLGGLRSAMTYGGSRTISEFQRKAEFIMVNDSYSYESSIRK